MLDKILLDAAIEAGVDVRAGFTVEEILTEAEHVFGIRGRAKNGSAVTEKSAFVIGLMACILASPGQCRPPSIAPSRRWPAITNLLERRLCGCCRVLPA